MIEDADLPRNIWRHYLRTQEAFRLLESALSEPKIALRVSRDSPFYGLTPAQLPDVLREMMREVEMESSLALLAGFEARLRLDYLSRVRGSTTGADSVHSRILKLWTKFEHRLPFEELLDAWRDGTQADANVVRKFKQLFNFRDWLAHGRYWAPKGFAAFDTDTVVRVTAVLEQAIPGLPKLIDW